MLVKIFLVIWVLNKGWIDFRLVIKVGIFEELVMVIIFSVYEGNVEVELEMGIVIM